jgi:hypothetical protein
MICFVSHRSPGKVSELERPGRDDKLIRELISDIYQSEHQCESWPIDMCRSLHTELEMLRSITRPGVPSLIPSKLLIAY